MVQRRKPFESVPIKPSAYLDYKLYFKALYEVVKLSEPEYSFQKFAVDLGFEATTIMHQIVKGYRPLTIRALGQILKKLKLPKAESQYLTSLVEYGNAKDLATRDSSFNKLKDFKRDLLAEDLDRNLLDYFAEWYHPIVWEIVGTEGFQPDPEWIAKRILPRVKPEEVKQSLDLLLKLGLIRSENDSFVQTQNRVTTGHQIQNVALVSYHQNMLDHAKNALTQVSGTRRDVSSMTVSVSEEGAARLRAMIHAFQIQLLDEAERCEKSDQVYQINIQLFPFTE